MRRLLVGFGALVLSVAPSSVGADPGHAKPKITVLRWQDPPVTEE